MEIKKNIYWNGVLDKDLRIFDIIMETEFGTTYNSYTVKGSEKTALVETAKLKFFDGYLKSVEEVCPVSQISYIIVNHTEPDHAGSIEKLVELNPEITVVGTQIALNFLKEIVNRPFKSLAVKEGDTLSLGDKTFAFYPLPNLHWPDTMYSYIPEDRILFTCDSFGSHYAHDGILRSTVTDTEGYMRAAKYYFDNIIGPFKNPFMQNALNKIKDFKIDMICPGHGPVLDSSIEEIIEIYKKWCALPEKSVGKTVVIPYVSAYGYTGQLAAEIKNGIETCGVTAKLYDMVEADPSEVMNEIALADGVLFGTPTILQDALKPIWDLINQMYPPVFGKKHASAFGSYGWTGEGVPNVVERLKQLKLKTCEGYRVKFKPNEEQLKGAFEFGKKFAEEL